MAMSNNEGQVDAVQGPAEEFDPLSEMLSEMLGSETETDIGDSDGAVVVDLPEPVETFEPVEVTVETDAALEDVVEEPISLNPAAEAVDEAVVLLLPPVVAQPAEAASAEPEVPARVEDEPVFVYVDEQSGERTVPLPEVAPAPEPEIVGVVAQPEPPVIVSEPEAEAELQTNDPASLDAVISEIDRETAQASHEDFDFEERHAEAQRATRESCIVFLLDGTGYAIPIRNVLELDAMPRITAVPNVPGFVRGITNLRGEIIAVLDLRTLLGMDRNDAPARGRILIVRTADQLIAALAVDDVRGAASLALGELVQPAIPLQGKVARVLMGVGEHQNQVLNVLDVDKLFRTPEIQQFAAN
jgi:purine-binding chemotaxis protein CheW